MLLRSLITFPVRTFVMTELPESRDYLHFQMTMPGGIAGGPAEPLPLHIIAAEMLLKDASPFIEGLSGVIDDRNLGILRQAVQNLLADAKHGPTQQHVIVFTSAQTDNLVYLQSGAIVLFKLL